MRLLLSHVPQERPKPSSITKNLLLWLRQGKTINSIKNTMSILKFISFAGLGFGMGEIIGAMQNRWAYLSSITSDGPFMLESIKTRDSKYYGSYSHGSRGFGNYPIINTHLRCVECDRIFPRRDNTWNYQNRSTFCHHCGFKYRLLY